MHVVVEFRKRDFAGLDGLLKLCAVKMVEGLFMVETSRGCFDRAVGAGPIGDNEAFEVPFLLKNVGEQVFIFASKLAVDGVVGAHDRAWFGDFNADLERQQIRFPHGPPADDSAHLIPSAFLIVYGVMLYIPDDLLGLLALHAVPHESACQDGIFAHVFEGPAVARFTSEVYAAAESHVVTLRAQFPADERAVFAGGNRIPTRGGTQVRRQSRGVAAVFGAASHAISGVAHLNNGNTEPAYSKHKTGAAVAQISGGPRLAPSGHAVAMQEINFFIQSHFLDDKVRALVRRKARIHPGTLLCLAGRFVVLGIAAIVHAYQGKQSENGGKADSYRARQIHFHYEGSKGRNVRPHNSHIGGHKRIC